MPSSNKVACNLPEIPLQKKQEIRSRPPPKFVQSQSIKKQAKKSYFISTLATFIKTAPHFHFRQKQVSPPELPKFAADGQDTSNLHQDSVVYGFFVGFHPRHKEIGWESLI